MKTLITVAVILLAGHARAATPLDNSTIINAVLVSTGVTSGAQKSPYSLTIDLALADSASWEMTFQCAKGSMTITESNDGASWVPVNVAGSSITVSGASLTTTSNQLFAIQPPVYRYAQFVVTNSSAPAAGVAASCTATVIQFLKSLTQTSN